MSVINLEKFLVIVTSNIVPISFSFPSPLVFPLHLCYPFSSCPTALGYSVFYSFSSLTLCFSVLGVSVEMFSNSKILSSAMSSLLMSLSKVFFVTVTMFLISSFSF